MFGLDNLKSNPLYTIYIYSTSTKSTAKFPAFLTSFSDSYKSNWNSTTVYGKMDPIVSFKNTTRSISIGFDVPNASIEEAKLNMLYLNRIIKGMYPVYVSEFGNQGGGSQVVSSPPMYRVKMGNLICNSSYITEQIINDEYSQEFDSQLIASSLLGYIQDFAFNPDIQSGFFINNSLLLPKLVKASFTLNVIHEHPLGTEKIGNELYSRVRVDRTTAIDSYPHKYDDGKKNVPVKPTQQETTAMANATSQLNTDGVLSG